MSDPRRSPEADASAARESEPSRLDLEGDEDPPDPDDGEAEVVHFRIEDPIDERLDRWLADRLELSRTQVAELIVTGLVLVNGDSVRKSYVPERGDEIDATIPVPEPTSLEPEPIPIEVVYEDEHLAVVVKPSGLVVHPAPGHPSGTLVNALLHRLGRLSTTGGDTRPGIVHRLDKETSGLLVVARSDRAHRALAAALAKREIRRGYVAVAWGHLELDGDELAIDRPIGRDPKDRKRMAVVEGGRSAVTHLRRLERWRSAELLAIRLETGRTHQIRVHLASLGHPVVCDPLYAPGWERGFVGAGGRWAEELARRTGRLFLHAARLAFAHPISDESLHFTSELPEPLASAVEWARESS